MILVTAPENLIQERLKERSNTTNPSEATFEIYLERKKHFEDVAGEYVKIENSGDREELLSKLEKLSL